MDHLEDLDLHGIIILKWIEKIRAGWIRLDESASIWELMPDCCQHGNEPKGLEK